MPNKDFSELKEGTKDELVELFNTGSYSHSAVPEDEIIIDIDKDTSDFSNLSEKTKKEIAELSTAGKYSKEGTLEHTSAGFDGTRIIKIQEFLAEEQRKMREFHSMQKQEQAGQERNFADAELMKKNLGMHDSTIEHRFRKAEMFVMGSEKEKKLADYVSSANTLREQLDRTMEIAGRQDLKAQLLNALKLDKEKQYFK